MEKEGKKNQAGIESERNKIGDRSFVHEVGRDSQGEMVEFFRDSRGIVVCAKPFEARGYSLMKYGDPQAIQLAAREIFERVLKDRDLWAVIEQGQVVVINEARNVPTASFCLMKVLVEDLLNPYLKVKELMKIEWVRVGRQGMIAEDDYASLTREQREARIEQRGAYISDENLDRLRGKKVVLFDDLVITGTYEANQRRLLREAGVGEEDILPLYWVMVSDESRKDPSLEAEINQAVVKLLADMLPIVLKEGFIPTERVLKFVFGNSDLEQLRLFLQKLTEGEVGKSVLEQFWTAIHNGDGFDTMLRLRPGIEMLKGIINQSRNMYEGRID